MNIEEYQRLLYDFVSGQNQQAAQVLMDMCESHLAEFLQLNLSIFSKFQDPILCNISITLIFGQAKKGSIFLINDLAANFWKNFAQVIPASFQLNIIEERTKFLVSDIISYFGVYFYQTFQDENIQNYVLTLYQQNPNFEPYIINTIEEIVVSSSDFGGFSLDTLLKIIAINPLQFESSVVSRMKLYFSVIVRIFESNNEEFENIKIELIKLFPQLFKATLPPLFEKVISTISIFAESFSEFFKPFLDDFIPILCEFAKSPNCEFRNSAIFCLESFFEGSINMCSSYESYYKKVIPTLISIIAEINDNSPLEESLNDKASYIVARNSLCSFLERCQNPYVFFYVDDFFKQTVSEINQGNQLNFIYEKVPWPLLYAFIFALSYRNYNVIFQHFLKFKKENQIVDDDESIRTDQGELAYSEDYFEFIISFIPFLTDQYSNIHIRMAIYEMISSYSKIYNDLYLKTSESKLASILLANILNENISIFEQKAAATALMYYIQNGRYYLSDEEYNNLFLFSSSNIHTFPQHLIIFFIRILKIFIFSSVEKTHPEVFNIFVTTLINLYQNTKEKSEYLDIQIEIFNSLIEALVSKVKKAKNEIFPEILNDVLQMLNDCILISFQNKCQDEIKLKKSIIKCISLLGRHTIHLIMQYNLLGYSLESSIKDITIYKYFQFENVSVDKSMLIKIDNYEDKINKFYILANEQDEVKIALKMLNCLLPIVKSDINIEAVLNVCQKWITNSYHIEKIKKQSWNLLINLILNFTDSEQIEMLVNNFTEYFINYFGLGSNKYNKIILDAMNLFLSKYFINNNSIALITQKVVNYTEEIFVKITECNNNLINNELEQNVSVDDEFMPQNVSMYRNILQDCVITFFNTLLNKYPNETIPFFNQFYLQKLNEYLSNSVSFEYAIELKSSYITKTKDVQDATQHVKFLFDIFFFKYINQISFTSILWISEIFQNVELPIDFLRSLIILYKAFFSKDDLCELPEYSDLGLGSFAVLINSYGEHLKMSPPLIFPDAVYEDYDVSFDNLYDSAIYIFINAFPIWDEVFLSNDVFHLTANLLESQNKFIMYPPDFYRIWYNTLNRIDTFFMQPKTSFRFKKLIKFFNAQEELQNMLLSNFHDIQKDLWIKYANEILPIEFPDDSPDDSPP